MFKNSLKYILLPCLFAIFQLGCPDPIHFSLDSISPAQGTVDGGEEITLTGHEFFDEMDVRLDGKPCTSLIVKSKTEATCLVPDHVTGSVDVSILDVDQAVLSSLEKAFTYICLPAPLDGISIWANNGEDKVTQHDMRATCDPIHVSNSIWDWNERKIKIFGAKNEVVALNLIIETNKEDLNNVSVTFNTLNGPKKSKISSMGSNINNLYDWTNKNIELFYVRYLPIKGLSQSSYATYDERHIPKRLQRPQPKPNGAEGERTGTWEDRPDHDTYYPEIAVPIELEPNFKIKKQSNQSIWVDIFIPKDKAAALYKGTITVKAGSNTIGEIPVELTVKNFTLPDEPSSKTMLFLGYEDVSMRNFGVQIPDDDPVNGPKMDEIMDLHFQMAHRHKLSIIDSNRGWTQKRPRPPWEARLNGSLFTAANGYDGPGIGLGNEVYSVGTYGSWDWLQENNSSNAARQAMWDNTNAWEQWFIDFSPNTERFLFLIDESSNYTQTQMWAQWMKANPGVGKNLMSFATVNVVDAVNSIPSLDIPASWITVRDTETWEAANNSILNDNSKLFMAYNAFRPASGTFATEDDGVALRVLSWSQYKKKIHRWFYWQTTYYNDYQTGRGNNNLFHDAQTFGKTPSFDNILGVTSDLYSNGDGVLFYPGTDVLFPQDSYNIAGPIASLRLKHWRRGVQDIDYIAKAKAINPTKTKQIVDRMVPKVLWEVDVADPNDPTWQRTDISWSINPDDWEAARAELADIIDSGN